MTGTKKRVLILEDDRVSATYLQKELEQTFDVKVTHTCAECRREFRRQSYDAFILDVSLPDGDGIELAREISEGGEQAAILMLTASRPDESSAIRALAVGADDYLRKPFGGQEIVAKLRKLLNHSPILRAGEITLHQERREVFANGHVLDFSRREFDILWVLVQNKGKILSRVKLLESLQHESDMTDRSLDPHISRIRAKLKKVSGAGLSLSGVYGVGYQLEEVSGVPAKKAS